MFKSFFSTGIRAAYTVSENPTFVSDPWYVYPAKHKQTGRSVSVFIFDKAKFEASIGKMGRNTAKNPRVIISECYELLKFEISELAKLKHPQILTLYEPLEETKSKFLFVTESVSDNLQTADLAKIDPLTIQKGLLQTAKGLQFLHNQCCIVHFNLQPSSLFINAQGDWKLSGFRFVQNLKEISPSERENYYIMNNQSVVPFANLNLNFTAPEMIVDTKPLLDFGNDLWSLGCLIYYLYNRGDRLINCFDQESFNDYKTEFTKFSQKFFNHRPSDLRYVLKDIPDKMYVLFPRIMARYPHDRMSIDQFIESDFFNGSLIKAMWFLDEFSTKSIDEKLIFLRGLLEVDPETSVSVLESLPSSYRVSKLLPLLIDLISTELSVLTAEVPTHVDDIITVSLKIVFQIGSSLSGLTFQDRIYEHLLKDSKKTKVLSSLLATSVSIRLVMVESCDVFMAKLNDKQFVDVVKTIIQDLAKQPPSTEPTAIKLQETFLSNSTVFAGKLEFPYVKNTLFPLVCSTFKTTTVLSTKLVTIDTFGAFIDAKIIDKLIVSEQLLPIVKNVKSRDKRIISSLLGLFTQICASDHIAMEIDAMVEHVIPQCYSLAFGCEDCTQMEFKAFIGTVNKLSQLMVNKKLQTLSQKAPESSRSFETLIQSQTITKGNKESMEVGPKSDVMVPRTQKAPLTLKPKKPLSQKTIQHQSPQPQIQPSQKTTPLSFGATKPSQGLLNTLKGTDFSKADDDDFEDFQQASINWGTQNTTTSGHKSAHYPPGFDASIVLTPHR